MRLKVISTYKKVNYPGITYPITVNNDGTEIFYQGALVNQFLVKGKKHRAGQFAVSIEGKQIYRSRLVALGWVPNPRNYPLVLHNDCDTTYDYYRNLSWGTRYMMVQNLQVQKLCGVPAPEFRGTSKIPFEKIEEIVDQIKSGEPYRKIADQYDVSKMTITRIKKRYI